MAVDNPMLLIVPGAWLPSSAWNTLAQKLQAAGYQTRIVDLASTGVKNPAIRTHRSDVEVIHFALDQITNKDGREVVMITHAYGGFPTSDAVKGFEIQPGKTGGVLGVIFISAYIADVGESMQGLVDPNAGSEDTQPKAQSAQRGDEHSVSTPEVGMQLKLMHGNPAYIMPYKPYYWMYHDVPMEEAAESISSMLPHASLTFVTQAESTAWEYVRCGYICCTEDRAVPLSLQNSMLDKAKAKSKFPWIVSSVVSAHCPFLNSETCDDLVEAILSQLSAMDGSQKTNGQDEG